MEEIASHYEDKEYKKIDDNRDFVIRYILLHLEKLIGKVDSVIDIGCSLGAWLRVFKQNGVMDISGVDGDWIPKEYLLIPEKNFKAQNLEEPLNFPMKFSLALCLETAEHLSEERAEGLIDDLTKISDKVLFSAAIPFQGGRNHINEQWPDYWIDKFEERGYVTIDFRQEIKCLKDAWWYPQNLFLFIQKETLSQYSLINFGRPSFTYIHNSLLERIDKCRLQAQLI